MNKFSRGVALLLVIQLTPQFAFAADAPPVACKPAAQAPNPTAEQKSEASTRFTRGTQLYNEGDYKLALIEFNRAYELVPNYLVLYNIGQVNFQLNNYAGALKAFRQYLEEGCEAIPADRRHEVEADLQQLAARTAHVSVEADVLGADVTIDDVPAGKVPLTSLLVDAGQHKIVAVAPGHRDATQFVTLAPGDTTKIALKLPLIPTAGGGPNTPAPEKKSYTWVGWTTSAVLAAGAITTGILTANAYSNFKNERDAPAAPDDPDGTKKAQAINDDKSKTQTFYVTTAILGGAAVVAAGVTLYFTLKDNKGSANVKVGAGPGSVTVFGTF